MAKKKSKKRHLRKEFDERLGKLRPSSANSRKGSNKKARWCDYTKAYEAMIKATDTDYAPWYRVVADDKRSARLNCISHLLSMIAYKETPFRLPPLPKKKRRGKGMPDEIAFSHTVSNLY